MTENKPGTLGIAVPAQVNACAVGHADLVHGKWLGDFPARRIRVAFARFIRRSRLVQGRLPLPCGADGAVIGPESTATGRRR